ncbi:MAG: adenylate/guanylate cyclase domain-containing protein [Treponema sp.]|nr:adenylate/guanylate cyclase domain-containing protein [Treponema sp.]
MKKLTSRHFISAVLIFTVIAGFILDKAGAFHFLELKNYDSRVNFCAPSRTVSDDIIFIMVDQSSIDEAASRYGWSWPWPRETYGRILNYLDDGNAATCTYDILFTEPSVYGPEDDEAFAKSLGNCLNTKPIIAQFWDGDEENPGVLKPLDIFSNSAAFLANTTSIKDSDDIIRRTRISNTINGEELTFMGFVPPVLMGETLDDLPYEKDGTLKLNYKGSIDDYTHYTAIDILKSIEALEKGQDPEYESSNFQDAHVFVVYYAPGLFDICSTPVNKVYPGSGVSMTALDNYLTNSFIIPARGFVNLLLLIFFAALGTLGSFWCGKRKNTVKIAAALLVFYLLGLALILVLVYGLFLFRVDIKFINLLFAFAFSSIAMDSITFILEGKQKRFIKGAFSQYLSPAVINQLIENPEGLKLGGEKRNISIFFSDVQSFTTLSEGLSPESLTDLLNVYLSAMSSIILKSGGTIDKYEGDAIIAFWNAPVDIPNHSLKALMAAVECQETLSKMEDFFVKKVGRPMWTRIGLNTGDAVVGNMGSESRFDYTMFGDSVNLASRLEGLNKQFGTYLMCSEETKLQAQKNGSSSKDNATDSCPLYFRPLGKVQVVGKTEAVSVYEPITESTYLEKKESLETFEKGLNLFYEGKLEEALALFKSNAGDAPSQKYAEKCAAILKTSGWQENWRGIWIAEAK